MIVVPIKAKINILKVFYMDFLLSITSIIQTIYTLFLITLLFKRMLVESKSRK